jgi:hypothetical protein
VVNPGVVGSNRPVLGYEPYDRRLGYSRKKRATISSQFPEALPKNPNPSILVSSAVSVDVSMREVNDDALEVAHPERATRARRALVYGVLAVPVFGSNIAW